MNVLYHTTILPPKLPDAEALFQELRLLRAHFPGDVVYLNPNQTSPLYVPRFLFGYQALADLRRRERNIDLHHVYNPDPYAFPVLRHLRKPIVYSISGGVGERRPNIPFFNSLAAVVVSDERSLHRLQGWGLKNCLLVRPGIDAARFTYTPLALERSMRLLIASAPWTVEQFASKGIDALLGAAQQTSDLHLTFLWRGVLGAEMEQRVRSLGLKERVCVIDKQVDVNQMLANVHAAIALATRPGIIRAYPHSLLDSLAAGKPVLVSRTIPMSDYVEKTGCGVVVERVTPAQILQAVEQVRNRYDDLQRAAAGAHDFSAEALVRRMSAVYETTLSRMRAQ
jgi:glycosyltransferase involved in cell wall biosynthesis